MSRIVFMLLALARALRPPLRPPTRRVALQAVPINKGGKRGSRRQRHELRTLDFSEKAPPKPKARSKAHPGLQKLGAPTTPEATLKALQSNEIDAPTLAAGVASLCASQRRDLAIEAIQLRSLARDPRSLTTAVTALCRAAAPKACVPLIDIEGSVVGVLQVMGRVDMQLRTAQFDALRVLAHELVQPPNRRLRPLQKLVVGAPPIACERAHAVASWPRSPLVVEQFE